VVLDRARLPHRQDGLSRLAGTGTLYNNNYAGIALSRGGRPYLASWAGIYLHARHIVVTFTSCFVTAVGATIGAWPPTHAHFPSLCEGETAHSGTGGASAPYRRARADAGARSFPRALSAGGSPVAAWSLFIAVFMPTGQARSREKANSWQRSLAIGDDAVLSHFARGGIAELSGPRVGGRSTVTVARRVSSRRGIRVHAVTELPQSAITTFFRDPGYDPGARGSRSCSDDWPEPRFSGAWSRGGGSTCGTSGQPAGRDRELARSPRREAAPRRDRGRARRRPAQAPKTTSSSCSAASTSRSSRRTPTSQASRAGLTADFLFEQQKS